MKTILKVKGTLLILAALYFKKLVFIGWCCSSMSCELVEIAVRFYKQHQEQDF